MKGYLVYLANLAKSCERITTLASGSKNEGNMGVKTKSFHIFDYLQILMLRTSLRLTKF